MQEFSRFSRLLAGLVGYEISPLKIKNVPKNKNVKKRVFFKKNNKKPTELFIIYSKKKGGWERRQDL